jgi:hypothetical protein
MCKAPINRITGGTGTAQSEVADLKLGGVSDDNSWNDIGRSGWPDERI